MALATEGKYDLAVDTNVLRQCGKEYADIGEQLLDLSKELDACLTELKDNGWTTNAGKTFQKMVDATWEENIRKYADLLSTLNNILQESAQSYDDLIQEAEHTVL